MSFWCLQFPPKNEWKQVKLRFQSSKEEFVCSFFGGNIYLKKSFWLFLTFTNFSKTFSSQWWMSSDLHLKPRSFKFLQLSIWRWDKILTFNKSQISKPAKSSMLWFHGVKKNVDSRNFIQLSYTRMPDS